MKIAEKYRKAEPSKIQKIFQVAAANPDIVSLGIGEPDFDTEHDIIDEAARAAKAGYTHYPPIQGYEDVRKAVCTYWDRRYGLKSTPDEVLVMAGGVQSLHLALQALLEPGDEVITPEPCFPPYFDQIAQHDGVAVHLPTTEDDGFIPTPEAIERAVTPRSRALLLCSPSNPTGRVMTRAQMEGIAAVAEKHDLVVLSDEIYDALVFRGKHVPFASLPGMKARTLTMSGLSKSHCMTGWRLGYAIGPAELIRTMCLIAANQTYGVCAPSQRAMLYALNAHDGKIDERLAAFRERLTYVAGRLNVMPGVSCAEPEGAFYLFPNIKGTGMTSDAFAWGLLEKGRVATLPGSAFGACGEGYLRLACTCAMPKLVTAMDRMAAYAASIRA